MSEATDNLASNRPALMFVGECRSLTAKRKNWTWKDGRLAAKPLFEALRSMGVDPASHRYTNLWSDNAEPTIGWQKVAILRRWVEDGGMLVALGKKVSTELTKRSINHVALIHPAARGKIRKRERYHAHVREKLAPIVGNVEAQSIKLTSRMRAVLIDCVRSGRVLWGVHRAHTRSIRALKRRGLVESGNGRTVPTLAGRNLVQLWSQ